MGMGLSLESLYSTLLGGGGIVLILLTLVQISPIQINPWNKLATWLGKALNASVLQELESVKKQCEATNARLDERVRVEDERAADNWRERILQFNVELMRDIPHTREDFIEMLDIIDRYEKYCTAHPEYPNSRAVHAVANIERVYDDRLKENDFYKAETQPKPKQTQERIDSE